MYYQKKTVWRFTQKHAYIIKFKGKKLWILIISLEVENIFRSSVQISVLFNLTTNYSQTCIEQFKTKDIHCSTLFEWLPMNIKPPFKYDLCFLYHLHILSFLAFLMRVLDNCKRVARSIYNKLTPLTIFYLLFFTLDAAKNDSLL